MRRSIVSYRSDLAAAAGRTCRSSRFNASRIGVQNADIEESIATSIGSVASKRFISSPETPLISRDGFVGALQDNLY
jgi:hypothetical protein